VKTRRMNCNCEEPDFVLCTPTVYSENGARLLRRNRKYIRQYVCHHCGGIAANKPSEFVYEAGESVMIRLLELGLIKGE